MKTWGLWEGTGYEGGTFTNGIPAFVKEFPDSYAAISQVKWELESAVHEPESRLSDTKPASVLILDYPNPRAIEK